MDNTEVLRRALEAVQTFLDHRFRTRIGNNRAFGILLPEQSEWGLAIAFEQASGLEGLAFYRGAAAKGWVTHIYATQDLGDDVEQGADVLGFSLVPAEDMNPVLLATLRRAGAALPGIKDLPVFMAKRPFCRPRRPDDAELVVLTLVLRGLVEADRRGELEPTVSPSGQGLFALEVTGDPAAPEVRARRQVWPDEEPVPPPVAPLALPDLSGLPRLETTWLVGMPTLDVGVEDDERTVRFVAVLDATEAEPKLLDYDVGYADELGDAAEVFLRVFRGGAMGGRAGVPKRVAFSSRMLYEACAPGLREQGIDCEYRGTIPDVLAVRDALGEVIASRLDEAEDAVPPEFVAASGDLDGWKAADRRLTRRIARFTENDARFDGRRGVTRYFGEDDLEGFLADFADIGVLPAYAAWAYVNYRPTRRSKSRADEALARGLPEAEARLLRARIEAPPSLYQIEARDAEAGTLDMNDILLGGRVIVHDRRLAESCEDVAALPGRAFPAGGFHFFEQIGPPLTAPMVAEAVSVLQEWGLTFTREGLRQGAHLFGRLWDWADGFWQGGLPEFQNSDGEPLVFHDASFQVEDEAAVRRHLAGRDDMEYDEANDSYVWLASAGSDDAAVILGNVSFIANKAVLQVNSEGRFQRARAWLETVPGVTFVNVMTRTPEDVLPPDDRFASEGEIEPSPDLLLAAREMLARRYMEWLDRPLPALGGRTPREVARTPEGRDRIARLIRAIPAAEGTVPVQVPRDAMFRELGLPVSRLESGRPDAAFPLLEGVGPITGDQKVGRNEPCPCRSGKKYKKCCGRKG